MRKHQLKALATCALLLIIGCDSKSKVGSESSNSQKTESKPVRIIYEGTISAQGFSQSIVLTVKTDYSEAAINGPMTPLFQSSPGVYTWTTGTITGMSIRPEEKMCSIYTVDGELLGRVYKTKEELADGTQRSDSGQKNSKSNICGDEYSAKRGVEGYLSDKGFNQLAGEYEAEIDEMRAIGDCTYNCKIKITSYQDPMGYDAVYKNLKVEWSSYDGKYVVSGTF